jgi:hypothetical protein
MKRLIYKLLGLSNDLNAIRRGPRAVARRAARRAYGKATGRLARKVFG